MVRYLTTTVVEPPKMHSLNGHSLVGLSFQQGSGPLLDSIISAIALDFVRNPAVISVMDKKDQIIKTVRATFDRAPILTDIGTTQRIARTEYRLTLRERAKVWLMRGTTS